MDIDTYGWIKASEYREKVLLALDSKPIPPKDIAEETGYYLSHVSNTLNDLEEQDLANCITPDRRKGRLWAPTATGEEIISELKR